jgi:small conductance mechanosensitive channel
LSALFSFIDKKFQLIKKELEMDDLSIYAEKGIELLLEYGPKLLLAILTLIVGLYVIKLLDKGFERAMEKGNIEISLKKFLLSMVRILLKILLFISVISMLGVEMTSFIALLGAAGLAVGLSLQGSLANFAGGVLLLLFKPFKVGDFIETQGFKGTVHSIQVFNTVLKTPDNKTIVIPNGNLSNGSITNFTTESTRRIDMTFGIGYSDDIRKAKDLLNRLVKEDGRILQDPAPRIAVSELGDSSVNFAVWVWCNSSDYLNIKFDMQENVKLTFDSEGISIPFPQRDVHVYNH